MPVNCGFWHQQLSIPVIVNATSYFISLFVPINRNYKLLLKFWSWIKNYISIEYYRLDKSISVVNIVVVDTLIQWYDIISSLIITTMFYQFDDLLGEHQTLGFPSCCNFSTLIEPLNTFVPRILDDSTYRKLSSDPEHVVQWFWTWKSAIFTFNSDFILNCWPTPNCSSILGGLRK
jgi:hypothetical protein